MKKVKLIIREKGMYVEIPGVTPFRSPAKVDVTKVNLAILIQSLHSNGVNNYELVTSDGKEDVVYTEQDFKLPEKKTNDGNMDNRLDRLEDLLLKIISNGASQKSNSSEQITNRLNRIERMLSSGSSITHTTDKTPVIEEMNDQYIPEIDLSDMQISGKTSEVVEKTLSEDISNAVDLLSNLTKNGGK